MAVLGPGPRRCNLSEVLLRLSGTACMTIIMTRIITSPAGQDPVIPVMTRMMMMMIMIGRST